MNVWVYTGSSKDVGNDDQLKVFGSKKEADVWLAEHDPEGLASEYSQQTKPKIELKEWLILVPAVGSGVAVIYEIGSFIPLGSAAFGLFSLSDHLLWALQALPAAMGLVAGILVPMTMTAVLPRAAPYLTREEYKVGFRRIVADVVVLLALAAFAYAMKSVVLSLFVAIGAFITFVPEKKVTSGMAAAVIFLSLTGSILAIGIDIARRTLNVAEPATFDFGGGNVKALVLVRSGDRGMLLYDRPANELIYVKSDELKKINWQRQPLRSWFSFH